MFTLIVVTVPEKGLVEVKCVFPKTLLHFYSMTNTFPHLNETMCQCIKYNPKFTIDYY